MGPEQPLPFPKEFSDAETYVESILRFATESVILQTLCGGVHILDFFTREPDLYSLILPEDWRAWFRSVDIADVLDLLLREDLSPLFDSNPRITTWRHSVVPPYTLIRYIKDVRMHFLDRDSHFQGPKNVVGKLSGRVTVGMKPKKIHEVDCFTRWINRLTESLAQERNIYITHFVDFGSGQNFLGRALASTPYNKSVIAIESRPHVVQTAKHMDMLAKISEKPNAQVDKKKVRAARAAGETIVPEKSGGSSNPFYTTSNGYKVQTSEYVQTVRATLELPQDGKGSIQYVEHNVKDGDLSAVIDQIVDRPTTPSDTSSSEQQLSSLRRSTQPAEPALMVLSIHSCGNLSHHGLRTLTLNPTVQAVAIIGCCYNLLTERLGPGTYKHPMLRSHHPRLESTSNARDEHGFPMSQRFCTYEHPILEPRRKPRSNAAKQTGLRLNITSRMMAVQAPANWGPADSAAFFTRHFYRALLQRIFLDKGIVSAPVPAFSAPDDGTGVGGVSPAGGGREPAGTEPIVIGALAKGCYRDFVTYVRGAVAKIVAAGLPCAAAVEAGVGAMSDKEIRDYEAAYAERKKELSATWSLMAFSAGVVESLIVLDRWCWLREQEGVEKAWVEALFDYGLSPRNLVVVGIKKQKSEHEVAR